QPALRVPGGTQRPDYVFFRDEQALNALKQRVLDDTLLAGTAVAVGDAKYWDRPLGLRPRPALAGHGPGGRDRVCAERRRGAEGAGLPRAPPRGPGLSRLSCQWPAGRPGDPEADPRQRPDPALPA